MVTFSLTTALSLLNLLAAAAAGPVEKSTTAASPLSKRDWGCPESGKRRVIPTASYNVYPEDPKFVGPRVAGFETRTYENKSIIEHVIHFTGIPKEAKDCQLGWTQSDELHRVFVTSGSTALMNLRPLSGLPVDSGVSYESIGPFNNSSPEEIKRPDFTLWSDFGASNHTSGGVNCKQQMAYLVKLDDVTAKSHVYLKNDEVNGFWIEYEC